MKIPETAIPFTFTESKRVFENILSIKEAVENIHKNCGIKVSSSADYDYFFRYLMTGQGSCRVLNSYTQKYYLERIKKEYNKEQLEKSLAAFKKLIEKFEGKNGVTKVNMRKIYEECLKLK